MFPHEIGDELKKLRETFESFKDVYMQHNEITIRDSSNEWRPRKAKDVEGIEVHRVVPNLFFSGLMMTPPSNLKRKSCKVILENDIRGVVDFGAYNRRTHWINPDIRFQENDYFFVRSVNDRFCADDIANSFDFIDSRLRENRPVLMMAFTVEMAALFANVYLHRRKYDAAVIRSIFSNISVKFDKEYATELLRSVKAADSKRKREEPKEEEEEEEEEEIFVSSLAPPTPVQAPAPVPIKKKRGRKKKIKN